MHVFDTIATSTILLYYVFFILQGECVYSKIIALATLQLLVLKINIKMVERRVTVGCSNIYKHAVSLF